MVQQVLRYNDTELPEKELAKALLRALETFEDELRRDRDAHVLDDNEARKIDEYERAETARLLTRLYELERRYPPRLA